MRVVAVIQARMSSSRLPGKVLRPVLGKPLIQYVVEKTKQIKSVDDVVIATSTQVSDDALAEWVKNENISYVRGSEDNVLDRYHQAAVESKADHIVRITGDCPLLESHIAEQVVQLHLKKSADYTANTIKRTFPRGWDVEMFTMKLLEQAKKEAKDSFQTEHVTPFFWQQPNRFHLESLEASGKFKRPDLRICVDTIDDFNLIKTILEACHERQLDPSGEVILNLFDEFPEWIKINQHVAQKHA